MEFIKGLLMVVYVAVAVVLIVLTLIQTKDGSVASSTVTGSSTNNFYNQNKGRTKEGKMKKLTIILGIVFVVFAVLLSVVYF